jgi:hypothetical protein
VTQPHNATTPVAPTVIPAPPIIHPQAVYTLEQARQALGLSETCLPREARKGRLRVARLGGVNYTLGAWLLAWVRGKEVRRKRREGPAAA